jgi:hypothetical protein
MPKLSNTKQANMIRKKPERKDKYYTPESLVDIHLSKFAGLLDGYMILEPFRGTGNYFNKLPDYFPTCFYEWAEIDDGRDFFHYQGHPDIIISNPPFSLLDKIFERCYELKPKIISFVLNQHAVTPCRIRRANEAGYFVMHYHLTRVDKWFGVACILTLSNERRTNIIDFDCTKHILETTS